MYQTGNIVQVDDKFQTGYSYEISHAYGDVETDDFRPFYSPKDMLEMGVFEGKYCNDCTDEFPPEWFSKAKISKVPDPTLNFFGLKSRQPLSVWQQKGWIIDPDPRGWFQWFCRYYLGRRITGVDEIQIRRWRGIARHAAQVSKNCDVGDVYCRPRQRQTLLQWSYDPLV